MTYIPLLVGAVVYGLGLGVVVRVILSATGTR